MIGFQIAGLRSKQVGQWPRMYKFMVIMLIVIGSMILGYATMVKGQWDHYRTLQSQAYHLKTELEIKYSAVAQSSDYKAQIRSIKKRAEVLFNSVALKNEMPHVLESLSKIGLSSGLSFTVLTPLADVAHDFYIESSIKLSVLANYQQLIVFMYKLAQMPKMVLLDDFVLSVDPQPSSKPTLQMDMIIKFYRYRNT